MGRAEEVWRLLARRLSPGPAAFLREPGSPLPVTCWPMSQAIHAASLLQPDAVPRMFRAGRAYRAGQGYRESVLHGRRYYDDNAWMALASLQHHRVTGDLRSLSRAQWIVAFLRTGQRNGGYLWVEGGDAIHACSTGAAGLAASALGHDASAALRVLADMRRGDGVVGDHRRADGSLDAAAFSYNQGLFIALARRCGAKKLLAEAIDAGDAYYTAERLWQQPVAFNAVYGRGLCAARAQLGQVADYADALWREGRDEDGWFTRAGRYDDGRVLDAAGAAQLFCLVDGFDASLVI